MANITISDLRNEAIKLIEYLEEEPGDRKLQQRLARIFAIIALKHFGFTEICSISDDNEISRRFNKLNMKLFGNIVANKDGQKYIIAIKTRDKYQRDGRPNPYIKNLVNKRQEKVFMASPAMVQQKIGAIPNWILVIYDKTPKGIFFSIYFGGMENTKKRNLHLDKVSLDQYTLLLENYESKHVLEYYRCDILVTIPLEEEFNIFRECCEVKPFERGGNIDYYCVQESFKDLHVYCLILGQSGPTYAGIITTQAIMTYDPRIVVLIGIGGAIDDELRVGDVVIGSQIRAYQVDKKITPEGEFCSERSWPIEQELFNYLLGFTSKYPDLCGNWSDQLSKWIRKNKFTLEQKEKILDTPKITLGYIASGDTVGSSEKFVKELKSRDRKYKVLEMEAAGVVESCHAHEKKVDSLVIRGISDFAYQDKKLLDTLFKGKNRQLAMISATRLFSCIIHTNGFINIIRKIK